MRRRRLEADHLMTAQRRKNLLEGAANSAAQDWTVNDRLADSRRALYLSGGRRADESDLHSLYR